MADLILDWGLLGPYNSALTAGATATVDTGGVAVDITFTQAIRVPRPSPSRPTAMSRRASRSIRIPTSSCSATAVTISTP